MNRPPSNGFALVLVLWALVLLTVIGLSFGFAVRVESGSGIALTDQVKAEAIATAGVKRAILGLIATDTEQRWVADGREYAIPWPDATLRVMMMAENGKLDLNFAPRQLLAGLFVNLFPERDENTLADAVLDWRDRDDRVSEQGAEHGEYAAAARLGPANAKFSSVSELSQVLGFDGEMTERAAPFLTIYGRQPRINAVAAELEVLTAIPGVTPDAALQFIAQRATAFSEDQSVDTSLLGAGARYLDPRPSAPIIAIRATAELIGGGSATIEAVVQTSARRGQAYTTLDWRQPMPKTTYGEES